MKTIGLATKRILILVVIMAGLMLWGGCADQNFRVAMVNDTPHMLEEVHCRYPGGTGGTGSGDAGILGAGPGMSAIADANRPQGGPIQVSWKEPTAAYTVDIPFKKEYIVCPSGIMEVHILPDHTVSIAGFRLTYQPQHHTELVYGPDVFQAHRLVRLPNVIPSPK